MKRHLSGHVGRLISSHKLLANSKSRTNLTSSLMDTRHWLLDSSSCRNKLLMMNNFLSTPHLRYYSTTRFVNNNENNENKDQNNDKQTNFQKNRGRIYAFTFLGLAIILCEGVFYYFQYSQLENIDIIQKENLTDGGICKIYGRINSNKILTLESVESEEPVLIYETSKKNRKYYVGYMKRDRLRCYSEDLEVNFSFGVVSKDWFESSDLTESLRVELEPDCEIFMETKEYTESVQKYNEHIGKVVKMNPGSKIRHTAIVELVDVFDARIIQRVLNRNSQVILIGKVDPESGIFKCKTLVSPNESPLYSNINRDLATAAAWTTFCFVVSAIAAM